MRHPTIETVSTPLQLRHCRVADPDDPAYCMGDDVPAEGPEQDWMMVFHRSLGVTIFTVVVVRLVWRLTHPALPSPSGAPRIFWAVQPSKAAEGQGAGSYCPGCSSGWPAGYICAGRPPRSGNRLARSYTTRRAAQPHDPAAGSKQKLQRRAVERVIRIYQN